VNRADDRSGDQPPSINLNPFLAYAQSMKPLDGMPVYVTFFRDKFARSKQSEELTLPDLRERIEKATAKTKDSLPWLKLMMFGDRRNERQCLRHDDNVLEVSGIETDYDGEQIRFEVAIAALKAAGIRALIYTSPSHKPDKPRWRILAPFADPLPPQTRSAMVARINGVFSGALGSESFKLSQAYYFGSVGKNPDHRAVLLDGDFIDFRDDLDAGAVFDKAEQADEKPAGDAASNPFLAYGNRDSQWRALNEAALANLSAWVPELFPFPGLKLRRYKGGKGYRVTSKMLGRKLQEDLSITPRGIKDFGVHDMGDAQAGRRTAIDLVAEHGGKTFDEAVAWLRQRLGIISAYIDAADIDAVDHQQSRPKVKVPLADAPKLPVMKLLNDVLGGSTADIPPMRGLTGTMTRLGKMRIPDTHAFSGDDANAEQDNKDKLPPPEQTMLLTMNDYETAELIEEHIDFINIKGRSVCLPASFIKHYRTRSDQKLPTVAAIALAPIVLANGELLAPRGLDRNRGIIFEIPDQVRAIMPGPEACTEQAVAEAMRFLCDEWLCDVLTDCAGKAIIIALALTIMERSLLPERPAFWVTAGRRGGGKTTTLSILIFAVTGSLPAASAWSSNEEERRKALLAQLMYGAPYILWDNITRGSQLSCPHIERSCTTEIYSDRRLGVSEMVYAAASAIHVFTGNNVGPRGDLASRSLKVELTVDRPDPENREFKHPDPIGWTTDHRASLLRAFYTVMTGNPQLKAKRNAPSKTRFKLWWRLVGSAIEHAARLNDATTPIDFESLFLNQEETEDEDTVTLGEALKAMSQRWPKGFLASEVADEINAAAAAFNNDRIANPVFCGMLQNFLYGSMPRDFLASPRSVGKQLRKHLNNPVKCDGQVLILRRTDQSAARGRGLEYFIEVKAAP
jgi:hypothetical protein